MPNKEHIEKLLGEPEHKNDKGVENRKQNETPFLSIKSVLLSLLLVIVLGMLKNINSYGRMYYKHISASYEEMSEIKDRESYNDIEVRKRHRWGKQYTVLKGIRLRTKGHPSPIVLVPPQPYIKEMYPSFEIPEPAVCYYYSGLKIAWGSSKYVYQSTHAFVVSKKGADVIEITSRQQIDSLLGVYKAYKYYPAQK